VLGGRKRDVVLRDLCVHLTSLGTTSCFKGFQIHENEVACSGFWGQKNHVNSEESRLAAADAKLLYIQLNHISGHKKRRKVCVHHKEVGSFWQS
jgi:hypothetical protein